MTERPILFSAPMVRAILDGRKSQTRRAVKPVPPAHMPWNAGLRENRSLQPDSWVWATDSSGCWWPHARGMPCPYGTVGDRLWVRETYTTGNGVVHAHRINYRADDEWKPPGATWRSPRFMPRTASRITLEITGVRVERVQDISRDDAIAEGLIRKEGVLETWWQNGLEREGTFLSPVECYRELWDSINGKRAPWASNPWVWVISFRRVTS